MLSTSLERAISIALLGFQRTTLVAIASNGRNRANLIPENEKGHTTI